MKTKTKPAKHVDACPASCKTVHEMCDWRGCARIGQHFAKDHGTKPKVQRLAEKFSTLIRRDLTSSELKEAVALNAKASKKVCHTHDFIDANMTMAEAFEAVVGHSPEVHGEDESSRTDVSLWNEAWDIAKAAKFTLGNGGR